MDVAASREGLPRSAGAWIASRPWWRADIGWQGVALVVTMALVNALRRAVFSLASGDPLGPIGFADAMATGLVIGFIMLFAVVVALSRHPKRGNAQYVAIVVAIAASSAIGAALKAVWDFVWAIDAATHRPIGWTTYFLKDWLRYAVPGALVAGAYLYLRAEVETAALTHECDLDAERMAREVAEARLRVLEAQIEPHFLFNTLASVKRLYRTDAGAGSRTLDNLMRYFSVALPQMRSPERTLAGEAALASAYLEIQRMRMGRRMAFTLDIAQAPDGASFPPFMLLTLVENAVKHGLDPVPAGGRVDVTARVSDRKLLVEVRDTGQGFTQASGAGTGLAGIRARLSLLYGDKADLSLRANEPHGVVATLVVPLDVAPRAIK